MSDQTTIERISAEAEHRGGRDARRADGAFFTSDDVAAWLARRAIGAQLLRATGVQEDAIATVLATGVNLHAALAERLVAEPARVRMARERLCGLRVLDPSCGAGAFLAAAWQELLRLQVVLDEHDPNGSRTRVAPRVDPRQLTGVDVDADAIRAADAVLTLLAGAGANLVQGDALAIDLAHACGGPADVVLGNPPYVRASPGDAPMGVASAAASNVAAWIVERALRVCAPDARIAMVLPISAASTSAWGAFRTAWSDACSVTHTAHFDAIPSALFADAVQRISIFEGSISGSSDERRGAWYTTRYHRWVRREREGLLERVRHTELDPRRDPARPLPKYGSGTERQLLDRIDALPGLGRWFASGRDDGRATNVVLYKRRWSYFLLFADFVPPIWDAHGEPRTPSELQRIVVDERVPARAVIAICSSTLFWWWFSTMTDNRNVNRTELRAFGVPELDATQLRELDVLGGELMDALHACGEVRECTYRSVGTIRNTYYRQAATRPVLDRIDRALARAYGMTAVELEHVLAFERRFRS